MPKIKEVYFAAIEKGKGVGVLSQDIRLLIAHDMGYAEPIDTLYHQNDEFTPKEDFYAQFDRLCKGEPVEYILKEAKFLNSKIYVDERVLIPRMETEELIANLSECIMDYYDPRNYLVVGEIGTGSGCISIALKQLFHNWLITATDISSDALEVAKKNFDSYGYNIKTIQGDGVKPFIDENMALDILVSNPPYILNKDDVQDSVKNYEPAQALYLDKNHSVYEDVFKNYKAIKKGTLLMCFEIGYDLKDYLEELMKKYLSNYDYRYIEDLNGLPRFLFVFCR